ncbi:hypothetical protein [Pseudomonas sp. nanlin1]
MGSFTVAGIEISGIYAAQIGHSSCAARQTGRRSAAKELISP